ncbi:MAG: hypothetical protein VCA73_18735, partial [Roseibacillus sp.]
MITLRSSCITALLAVSLISAALAAPPKASGLLSWRGPDQNGVLPGVGYPESWALDGENHLWTYKVK